MVARNDESEKTDLATLHKGKHLQKLSRRSPFYTVRITLYECLTWYLTPKNKPQTFDLQQTFTQLQPSIMQEISFDISDKTPRNRI